MSWRSAASLTSLPAALLRGASTSPLLPRALCAGAARWMGRAPLFWRRLPPPPGYMPRAEPIQYEDIGMSYLVHSGKEYRRVKVTAQMVGHKYGEFVLTRKVRMPQPVATFFSARSLRYSPCRIDLAMHVCTPRPSSPDARGAQPVPPQRAPPPKDKQKGKKKR